MTELLLARRGPFELLRQPREVSRALRHARDTATVVVGQVKAIKVATQSVYEAVGELADEEEWSVVVHAPVAEPRLRHIGNVGTARFARLISRMEP